MRTPRTPRTVANRLLLAVTGLALLALGLAVLAGGLDAGVRRNLSLPSWWPYQGPDDVLLSAGDRTAHRDRDWWWPVLFGGLALVVVAALGWLLAQVRTGRARRIRLDGGDGQVTLRGDALAAVLAAEAGTVAGVRGAHARVIGGGRAQRRRGPAGDRAAAGRGGLRVRLSVVLDPQAGPAAVAARLDAEVLERARGSLGAERLPAEVRLRPARHKPSRVS
ncbi:alkaline shock response membrane anchor protein AmaP [Streptomyces sp. NPDC018031]|uniref:alkaline shock response membrane anchor protein AmaP n=1 Tax=Streptomyces sp. NPDC018031 TaxID=3365033 RepID=UPI0037B2CF93